MALGVLIGAIDDLVAADASAVSDPETLVELHRQLARMEAVVARADADFETSGAWAPDGAQTAGAWLAASTHEPRSSVQRSLRLGRAMRVLPAAGEAWLAGGLDSAHLAALSRVQRTATEEALARDEAMLVAEAKRLSFASWTKALAYWELHADPDGAERGAEDDYESRAVHLSQSFKEHWIGDMRFDPISGTIVAGELGRIYDELFRAGWAAAKERLGREPLVSHLGRTPAQRRADAMVEMARRSAATPEGARRPEPLFSVLVGYETFSTMLCELADGTVVAPGALLRWLTEAWIERVVMDGPSRVLDLGRSQRLFTGATRRAVELALRQCFHWTCERPAEACQGDHVLPWFEGGRTDRDNGQPACGFHNRLRSRQPRAGPDPP